MYLADQIKGEYEKWTEEQTIMISAPTGAGKTYFVLHVLLPYAMKNGKKILYLTNRTILKEQLEKEAQLVYYENANDCSAYNTMDSYIEIVMYQTLEATRYHEKRYINYIIADECHYFLTDSFFNSKTDVSFSWVMSHRGRSTLVFISATIELFEEYFYFKVPYIYNFWRGKEYYLSRGYVKEYRIESSRNIFEPIFLEDFPALLKELEKSGDEKWLIFVSSKKHGDFLVNELKSKRVSVGKIYSGYSKDSEMKEYVDKIVKTKVLPETVTIVTSVLDNGISVHDPKVKHIVISTDTREELIQMLGRKRISKDDTKIKLYLFAGNREMFRKRLESEILQRLEAIQKYKADPSKAIIDVALDSENKNYLGTVCYKTADNIVLLNQLTEYYLYHLFVEYQTIMREFDECGEDAFLIRQLKWLGIDSIEEYLNLYHDKRLEDSLSFFEEYFDKLLNGEKEVKLTKEENIRVHDDIRKKAMVALKECTNGDMEDKMYNNFYRANREMSENIFNEFCKKIGLPYQMKTIREVGYFISRK